MRGDATKNLTQGKPMRLIMGFMLPMLLGLLFQQLYSMVDTMVVGKILGVDCLAGVGSTGSVNFLVLGFCMGVCSGFTIPVAQKFGQRDFAGLRKYVGNMIWLSVAVSAVVTVAVCLLCGKILDWTNTPEDVWQYAYDYIFVIFLGIPVIFLYNVLSGLMRSLGDSKTPLYFLILSSLLNVALDLLFILTFHMGVAGAGWATVLSQLVSGVLCLWVITRRFPVLRLNREDLRPDRWYMKRLWGMGLPMGLQYSVTAIGSLLLQTAVNGLGPAAMAAVTAGGKVNQIFSCVTDAMGTTMATYAGQNVGAGRLDRLGKGVNACGLLAVVYSVAACGILWVFGGDLSMLFVDMADPHAAEILEKSHEFLRILSCFFIPLAYVNILRFTIQGMGFSQLAVFAGVFEMVARGVVAALVSLWGYTAACFAHPAAWVMADVFLVPAFYICLRKLEKQYGQRAGLQKAERV